MTVDLEWSMDFVFLEEMMILFLPSVFTVKKARLERTRPGSEN